MRSIKEDLPETRIMVHIERQGLADTEVFFKGKTYHELRDFVISASHPQVMEATPTTMHLIHDNHIPGLVLYCGHVKSCDPYIKMVNASNAHNHKLLKIYKYDKKHEHQELDDYNHEENIQPRVCIMDTKRSKVHHHWFKGNLSAESLEAFIERYFHYRPQAHHFSEHPEDYHSTGAKALTGHNYHREVIQSKRPLLVLVHHGYENETVLVDSFQASAQYLHKHTHHSVKFRVLNQRKNLTPLPILWSPTLVIIPIGVHDPDMFTYLAVESSSQQLYHPITRWELLNTAQQHLGVAICRTLHRDLPRLQSEHLSSRTDGIDRPDNSSVSDTELLQPDL